MTTSNTTTKNLILFKINQKIAENKGFLVKIMLDFLLVLVYIIRIITKKKDIHYE